MIVRRCLPLLLLTVGLWSWAPCEAWAQEEGGSESTPEPRTEATLEPADAETSSLSADYGFLPLEAFKLTARISNLVTHDLNKDGRQDLVLVDNGESRIDLLLARDPAQVQLAQEMPDKLEIQETNDVKDAWRFEHRKLPLTRKVEALAVADFNGDGWPDLCGIGDNHLILLLGDEAGKWDQVRERKITDQSLPISWRIAAGDIDGDSHDDLVTLGDSETILFYGSAEASLEKIERLPNTSNRFSYVWLEDLTGNKRLDLLYLTTDDPNRSLVVRFQDSTRKFGPEYRLEWPQPRSLELGDLDGKPGSELAAVDAQTGRVRMYRVNPQDPTTEQPTSPLVQFGFGPRSGGTVAGQHLAVGDINGDGLLDVVTVDSTAALMNVYLQDRRHGLRQAQQFPGLTGIRGLIIADVDGDKRAEVILASEREKVIAVSHWQDARLTFPESLPTVGTPMALCFADLQGSGKREIVYVSSARTGGLASYSLHKLSYRGDQEWQAGDFGGAESIPLESLRTAPSELIAVDADRDGRSDLMLLGNNVPITFLATNARGVPQVTDTNSSSRLGSVSPGRVTLGQLDGEAILVAEKNFARRVKYDSKGQWLVVDQYNAENPEAVIAGTAILDLDGDGLSEIVLVDTGTKRLRFLKRRDGVYRPWKDLEIGTFNYQSLATGDFNADGREDLLLFGSDRFGVVFTGQSGPALELLGSFESQLRDVKLADLVLGDLGGGPEKEVALVDTGKSRMEIISPRDGEWKSALNFKVFEVSRLGAGGQEPRELAIADVTGDGLPDLILLVHDRVLLYPQDPGPEIKDVKEEKEEKVPKEATVKKEEPTKSDPTDND